MQPAGECLAGEVGELPLLSQLRFSINPLMANLQTFNANSVFKKRDRITTDGMFSFRLLLDTMSVCF